VPDSPRSDARPFRCAPIALALAILALAGCGGVPGVKVPSIPTVPNAGSGSATFEIEGVTFQVSQSGSIQASFPGADKITYSGPLGCKGHYFTGDYTENIEVFFHYFRKSAYLLIDNGEEPIYTFGPPQRQGSRLVFSNATPRDRQITVSVDCATGT
jgi:hypothetical protein